MSSYSSPSSPQLRLNGHHRSRYLSRTSALIAVAVLGFVSLHYAANGRRGEKEAGTGGILSAAGGVFGSSSGREGSGIVLDGSRGMTDGSSTGRAGNPASGPWYGDIFTFLTSTSSYSFSSPSSSLGPFTSDTLETTCSWYSQPGALRLDTSDPFGSVWESILPSPGRRGRKCEARMSWMGALLDSVRGGEQAAKSGSDEERRDVGRDGDGDEAELPVISSEDPFPEPNPETVARALRPNALAKLSSKRILLMGDSIERVMFEHIQELIPDTATVNGTVLVSSNMNEVPEVVPNFPMPPGGYARKLQFPTTGTAGGDGRDAMRFDFLHFYGMDEAPRVTAVDDEEGGASDPEQAIDEAESIHPGIWADKGSNTPGTGPPTLSARFDRMSSVWNEDYDICVIGSGLWDLARFQRTEYLTRGVDDSIGLTVEWLSRWMEDAAGLIAMVRERYSCRIAWRILHDPRMNAGGWFLPANLQDGAIKSPPFTPLRVHQLRQAQLHLVLREGIEGIPFGMVMQAQGDKWLKDDIHPGPAGSAIYAEMLMEMLARSD